MMFWLSFADPDLPAGSQFLGVAIVEAPGFVEAVRQAHETGCNPGGEVRGTELPDDVRPVPEQYRNRLLSRADVARLEKVMTDG